MAAVALIAGLAGVIGSLSGCVVEPPRPAPAARIVVEPDPHTVAVQRREQIERRIGNESREIDNHVNQGYYPPPRGYELHRRLDAIAQETRDMAAQHGGGLSGEEQRALNQELDQLHHMIAG
ncbi:hypothetical protein B7H01_03470 [Pandoraea apista]|nr:hypothetical protein SG18_04620 [Pandoraea apista]AKH74948.1 hypothetical protein XM39_04620 [Pandoraea apista]AKI65084.1 hypothetical protein AA956_21940 [Pandoraea apista]ALS68221.1 hypothetical protein AT395_20345 [Pandoraea apista]OXS97495.1 hypothetical protein B7H01_03470 [Pandoraea apista]